MDSELHQQANTSTGSTAMVQHDFDADHSVTLAVIDAVSAVAGCEPTELPPLYDTINPDALNTLFSKQTVGNGTNPEVSFTYDEFSVTIAQNGPQFSVAVERR